VPDELLAFAGVAALVIVTPGQDTALTIRNTLAGGRRAGVFTALGVVSGQLAWTLATSAGLAALLVASEPAFRALRLAGAAYLLYLGTRSLLSALRGSHGHAALPAGRSTALSAYRQGLISNLGNAKIAVFFTSLLPQFVPAGEATFGRLLPLGVLFAAMTLVWLSAYAVAVARAGDVLRRERSRRTLDALLGTVLVGLAARLAVTER
jgi:threonine/homoserine/homoserine lactone efflux protein